jgi:hypothetical protein
MPMPAPSAEMEISSLGGFGYFTAVAPIARAAATPESDDPETKMPGKRSGASAGVSDRFSTL